MGFLVLKESEKEVFSFFLFLRKKVDAQETMKVEKKIKNEKQRRPEEPVEPREREEMKTYASIMF